MALTTKEETILKLKVELDILNKEKDSLVAIRAAKLAEAQDTYSTTVNGIHSTDDALIVTKESDIDAKQAQIDTELGK